MDGYIPQPSCENRENLSVGMYFVILAAIAAVFAAVGIKYSSGTEILDGLSYYGRYDGTNSSLYNHVTAAAECSAMCLIQLLVLFFLSFSPLLFPAAISVSGARAFVAGTAYSAVNGTSSALQLILYTAVTAIICFAAAKLMYLRKNSGGIISKTVTLTACAGASVIGEFVLSYL